MDIDLPYHQPFIEDDEINEVVETLKSGWLTTGPRTFQFEEDFRKYTESTHAIGLNSCTAGLHLAISVNSYDNYFLELNALNSSYLSDRIITHNPKINTRLLGTLRTFFMVANYSVGYLFFPKRIFRTLKNIFSSHEAITVLEHRLKDFIQRKFAVKVKSNHTKPI